MVGMAERVDLRLLVLEVATARLVLAETPAVAETAATAHPAVTPVTVMM
jgi:hypothetical protein